jgi:hypothetical protein
VKRFRFAALFIALAALVTIEQAPAAVDFSTGIRHVVDSGTDDDCGTKAKESLGAYLGNVNEPSPGEFLATGPLVQVGAPDVTASGTVHCYVHGAGYVVTFTCFVETPNNAYDADSLCLDIAHHFYGGQETALATPTPEPTGCTTANLTGDWTNDNNAKETFSMDGSGGLTGPDGVIGNWALSGTTATLVYYGNHTLTLSSDGKHLKGSGYSLTRKC